MTCVCVVGKDEVCVCVWVVVAGMCGVLGVR